MTDVLISRGHLVTDTDRSPCKDEARDKSDTSASQGMPRISSKPPEAKGQA